MSSLLQQDAHLRRIALRTWSGLFAMGFGSGLVRTAPGTMGTLAAVPLAWLLLQLPVAGFWLVWTGLFWAGVYWCEVTSRRLERVDPGCIVWDEMVAFWLVVAWVPLHWVWWLAAVGLFRLFDIVKPWPIRQIERRVKGGLGVMLDDLLAAGYALAVLLGLRWLLPGL